MNALEHLKDLKKQIKISTDVNGEIIYDIVNMFKKMGIVAINVDNQVTCIPMVWFDREFDTYQNVNTIIVKDDEVYVTNEWISPLNEKKAIFATDGINIDDLMKKSYWVEDHFEIVAESVAEFFSKNSRVYDVTFKYEKVINDKVFALNEKDAQSRAISLKGEKDFIMDDGYTFKEMTIKGKQDLF